MSKRDHENAAGRYEGKTHEFWIKPKMGFSFTKQAMRHEKGHALQFLAGQKLSVNELDRVHEMLKLSFNPKKGGKYWPTNKLDRMDKMVKLVVSYSMFGFT